MNTQTTTKFLSFCAQYFVLKVHCRVTAGSRSYGQSSPFAYVCVYVCVVGEPVVLETVRQIMTARAIYNIFRMTEFQLAVDSGAVR